MFKILCAIGIVFLLVDVGMPQSVYEQCRIQAIYLDQRDPEAEPDDTACSAYNSLKQNCEGHIGTHYFLTAVLEKFKKYPSKCVGKYQECKALADQMESIGESTVEHATKKTCQQYYDLLYQCGDDPGAEDAVKKYGIFEMYCEATSPMCRNMTDLAEELGDSNFNVTACQVMTTWAESCYSDAYALSKMEKYEPFIHRCQYSDPLGFCRNISDELISVQLTLESLEVRLDDCKTYYTFDSQCEGDYEAERIKDKLEIFEMLCRVTEAKHKKRCLAKARQFEVDMSNGGYPKTVFCIKYDALKTTCSNLVMEDGDLNGNEKISPVESFFSTYKEKYDKCKKQTFDTTCDGMAQSLTDEANDEDITGRICQVYNFVKDECSKEEKVDKILKNLERAELQTCLKITHEKQCDDIAKLLQEKKMNKNEADPVICGKYSVAKTMCADVDATKSIFKQLGVLDEKCKVRPAPSVGPQSKPDTTPVDPQPNPATPPMPVPDKPSESNTEATKAKTDATPTTNPSQNTSSTNGNNAATNATSTPGNNSTAKPSPPNDHPTTQKPSHNATENSAINQLASGFLMVHFCSFAIGVYAFAFFGRR